MLMYYLVFFIVMYFFLYNNFNVVWGASGNTKQTTFPKWCNYMNSISIYTPLW